MQEAWPQFVATGIVDGVYKVGPVRPTRAEAERDAGDPLTFPPVGSDRVAVWAFRPGGRGVEFQSLTEGVSW